MRGLSRRDLLKLVGAAPFWAGAPQQRGVKPVRFGVIADVHHGLALRTVERLEDFLSSASGKPLDFIIQLGDFNHPDSEAEPFLKVWQSHKGARYGVLGNHDMDKGSKSQALDLWQLRKRFYSFDAGFLHFVVLDANSMRADGVLVPYDKGNWYRSGISASWIDPEQIEWLKSDLAATKKPSIVFVHQAIDEAQGGGSVPNRAEVRKALEESGKVAACMMGHHHVDVDETRNEIYYWRVNSASYAWVGEAHGRMANYSRSLYAWVTIWPDGRMEVEGRRSVFEGESPLVRGVPEPERFSSSIRSRSQILDLA